MMNNRFLLSGGALVVCAILYVGFMWVKANYFEAGSFLVTKSIDVKNAVRLNVKGEDMRVYTYQVDGWDCIFTAGTNKGDQDCRWIGGSSNASSPTE